MGQVDLSVIIPARNEEFLDKTIQECLKSIQGNTEIIVILDGYLPDPPLTVDDSRVTVIYLPESVGQRAATNKAARLAKGKYLMKLDAHCALDEGFDIKMLEAFGQVGDNVTMIPVMRNLHIFDWICPDGHPYRHYQGRSDQHGKCPECGKECIKDIVWIPKTSPQSTAFRFDKTLHFQYWRDWGNMQKGDVTETMSIQGSCFMLTKERYFALDICSETDFHSWGQQGVEVACKTWLSGGQVMVARKTWYAHMFRTQGGDFSFPYDNPQSLVNENRQKSRELFQKNQWPLAIRPFQWILDHFNPPDWSETKGMIYYTDNQLNPTIAEPVRSKLLQISQEDKIPIVSSTLKKLDFGVKNIRFPSLKRGYPAMFKQILGALENTSADIIFFTEHDVLYHPSHFDFVPEDKETFYYNQNVWFIRSSDGHALHYDVNQLSGLCVYKETAITHFKERLQMVEEKLAENPNENDFNHWIRNMGFEPMSHNRIDWKNKFKLGNWKSEFPNLDIKHGANPTGQRWRKEQYRNQQLLINWTESTIDKIPGWTPPDYAFLNIVS